MRSKLVNFIGLWFIYALFAFPLFYFVYKCGNPFLTGLKDFSDYYKLYLDWDINGVEAPFNMRLVSSYLVYLLHSTGFYYDTATAFDQLNLRESVYFNAIFFNFICVVTTSVIIFNTVYKQNKNFLLSFLAGIIYFLGFGTIFYELMPITDAFSILLFALILKGYLARSYIIIIPLLILVLQREYVFLALGLISLLDYFKYRNYYYLKLLAVCIVCFGVYMVLRKTIFYTARYDHQASIGFFFGSIFEIKFDLVTYVRQTIMTLNIFIIYLLVIAYKTRQKLPIDRYNFWKIILLFLQINLISFAAVFGNNTGRYFYILSPLIIYYLVIEVEQLILKERSRELG